LRNSFGDAQGPERIFAVWGTFGFAFPAEPLALALNVISKILCFVAAIMLFVWWADGEVSGPRA
jgi:hypothetical protein